MAENGQRKLAYRPGQHPAETGKQANPMTPDDSENERDKAPDSSKFKIDKNAEAPSLSRRRFFTLRRAQ